MKTFHLKARLREIGIPLSEFFGRLKSKRKSLISYENRGGDSARGIAAELADTPQRKGLLPLTWIVVAFAPFVTCGPVLRNGFFLEEFCVLAALKPTTAALRSYALCKWMRRAIRPLHPLPLQWGTRCSYFMNSETIDWFILPCSKSFMHCTASLAARYEGPFSWGTGVATVSSVKPIQLACLLAAWECASPLKGEIAHAVPLDYRDDREGGRNFIFVPLGFDVCFQFT